MHYMSFISFFPFIFVAYYQYCPTTNKQLKCQTIKCFIYYQFINHNSQSNTLTKTIYKSQLTSYFLNSDPPTHQLPQKKNFSETDIQRLLSPKHNHIFKFNSQSYFAKKKIRDSYNHPQPKKKKNTTQSVNHRFTTQTLCQCYVRF